MNAFSAHVLTLYFTLASAFISVRAAFPDMDAGPTRAWLIAHRNEPPWKPYYDGAFAKRPAEELYDLRHDPHQLKNAAGEESCLSEKNQLAAKWMNVLKDTGDPRVSGDGTAFDRPPFSGPKQVGQRRPPANRPPPARIP